MYITKALKEPEDKLIASAIKGAYNKYYRNWSKYGDELFGEAFIETYKIKESIKDLSEKERYIEYFKVANNTMSKLIHKTYKNLDNVSMNQRIAKSGENKIELQQVIKDPKEIKTNIDYKFLIKALKTALKKQEEKERNIINEYLILKEKPSKIVKKYKIEKNELEKIVKDFRQLYFNILLKYKYITESEKERYLQNEDFKEKEEKEIKIIKLIKESKIPLEEIAKVLEMSEQDLNKRLNGKNSKFMLYEIQKLRRIYFNNYTLEELAEC